MIKLVACDLDGTLFNSKVEISQENIQAIRAAQENGIEFLIATGRGPTQSQQIIRKAGLKTGFININGALVFNKDGELQVKCAIPAAKVTQIVALLQKRHLYFEIIAANHAYTESIRKRIDYLAQMLVTLNPKLTLPQARITAANNKALLNIIEVNSYRELLVNKNIEVMKIIAFDARGADAFIDVKKDIKRLGGLAVTSSSAANIEINAERAQKGIALLDYAKIRGIKREEVAAIGDNLNDESMISNAGVGVAMGNAVPRIKKLAQVVTKTNNDNGVAYILNKFIAANAQK
ncbi:Cof-type HAD-IIB family hydrolase [Lactobacillus sp. ESL0791]|uniref:Cof-type HAD-IIB family hydrolase n=1 Tax=Lactobacillus sp. ESL0791 TaxID=2983234 RepID=UPI0023FA11CC|nr:Cof-type HAD-IIB family hydrolase [Lactobacillus sp. ESL0791]MDF7638633.1 Cof-type HAD-IIB family hydrolase [Lactobacillus sp. ESL0791]